MQVVVPPRARALVALCLTLLLMVSYCYSDDHHLNSVEVVGVGECSDCKQTNVLTSNALSGLRVSIDCKVANGKIKTRGVGQLDKQGKFKVALSSEILKENGEMKEACYAQLRSASNAPCPQQQQQQQQQQQAASKLIFKSKDKQGKHTFETKGKLSFSPITCTSAFLWPHYKYPPLLPKMPPITITHPWFKHLPKYKHPWFKSFPKHPWFKPLPPKFNIPPLPPMVFPPKVFPPIYKPHLPPAPIYKPPTKEPLPPPVPVYKPPITVTPTPVYKSPPKVEHHPVYKSPPKVEHHPVYKSPPKVEHHPVYKSPPKVEHHPVYKKPCPPPVPVYKPPTPEPKVEPPVYKKPLPPPVPIYKPPTPVPVYKPHPPIYIKPLPPIPHFPPIIKKPCPPLPKLPHLPKITIPPFPKIPPKYFHHHHPKFGSWPPLPPYPSHP